MARVPCNGCTACCKNDLIFLHPEMGDKASDYETMPAVNPITGKAGLAVKHKPEGGCVYLTGTGCGIHGRAPAICREFDCRRMFLKLGGRAERRRMLKIGLVSADVYEAARDRLHTLEKEPA